jgi:hypothetical protein
VTTSRSESLTWSSTRVVKSGCAAYTSSIAISRLSRLFFPSPVARSSITPTLTGTVAVGAAAAPAWPTPAAARSGRKAASRTMPPPASKGTPAEAAAARTRFCGMVIVSDIPMRRWSPVDSESAVELEPTLAFRSPSYHCSGGAR